MDLLSTGQVARLLDTTEPRLSETIRRGHLTPEPPIVAGRRLWDEPHIRQAAEALGFLSEDVDLLLAKNGGLR